MSNVKSLNFAKIGLALAVTVFAFAFAVSSALAAFSASQRAALEAAGYTDAQIDALDAILGGGVAESEDCGIEYTHSQTLAPGATGQLVTNWQTFLNTYADATLSTDGVYGPATKSATMSFQASNGLASDGIVGPNTASAAADVQSDCADADDDMEDQDDSDDTVECPAGYTCEKDGDDSDDSDNNVLEGGAGSISDVDFVNNLNNEEVGEGAEDVEVAGIDVEASEGSDLRIRALNIDFVQKSAGSDFHKYADEVSVWFDGEEVARVDAGSFNDDNNFRRTVSLDSNGNIIRADQEERIVVAVSGNSVIDSSDTGDTWDVTFQSIRFEDAQGAIITENGIGDLTATRTFSFEDFASASDVEFKVMSGDSDINDARVIDVDDTNETDDVELLSFNVKIEGDSDVELKDLPVNATIAGTATNLDDIFSTMTLEMDGDTLGSESAPASTQVVFNDIDTWLDAGFTHEFTLKGDILDTGAGSYVEGDTVSFAFGETETDDPEFDAEAEQGDNLGDSEKTGSESSEAHALYDNGIEVDVKSNTTTIVPEDGATNDNVEFTFDLDVHNFGDSSVFLTNEAAHLTASNESDELNILYNVERSAGAALTGKSGTIAAPGVSTATGDSGAYGTEYNGETFFKIDSGATESFTITVTGSNQTDAKQVRAYLSNIEWTTDEVDDSSGDSDGLSATMNSYTFQMQDETTTPYKFIN